MFSQCSYSSIRHKLVGIVFNSEGFCDMTLILTFFIGKCLEHGFDHYHGDQILLLCFFLQCLNLLECKGNSPITHCASSNLNVTD